MLNSPQKSKVPSILSLAKVSWLWLVAYIRCLFDPQRSNSTSLLSPFSLSVLWHITVLPYLLWINTHIHSFRADAFTRSSSTLMFQIHTLVYQHPMFKCCDTLQVLIYLWLMFFHHTVMSSSLWPHELQHTRLLCPSLSPGICSKSCPLRQLCQQSTILFSATPIPNCLQSYPALVSFLMIWLFASGGQNIATSASVLPMSSQCRFPLGLTRLICLQLNGLKSLLQHHSFKTSINWLSSFFMVQISHPCTTTGKNHTLIIWTFASKVMSLVA